jgi:hypothetical protein
MTVQTFSFGSRKSKLPNSRINSSRSRCRALASRLERLSNQISRKGTCAAKNHGQNRSFEQRETETPQITINIVLFSVIHAAGALMTIIVICANSDKSFRQFAKRRLFPIWWPFFKPVAGDCCRKIRPMENREGEGRATTSPR